MSKRDSLVLLEDIMLAIQRLAGTHRKWITARFLGMVDAQIAVLQSELLT